MPTTLPNGATPAVGTRTDPRREYVVGGGWPAARGPFYQALPRHIDDITQAFGADLYQRMLLDSAVRAAVETQKKAILADLSIQPVVSDEHLDYPVAREIADFCERNLKNLPRPFLTETLYDLLDAMAYGNRAAEIVLREAEPGEVEDYPILAAKGTRPLLLAAIKPKPQNAFAYVVDAYWNVVGLTGMRFDMPSAASGMVADPRAILPRWKFCVLTWNSQNGDPRGESILRPAYQPWWVKQQIWGEYLKYLTQFGSPSLVGMVGPNAQPRGRTDATGEPVLDEAGLQIIDYPETVLRDSLLDFKNGSVIALPHGGEVKTLQSTGQSTSVGPFTGAFSFCNSEIEKAITGQNLATSEGEHQARAAASVHQDTLGSGIQHGRAIGEEAIRQDILTLLVVSNYGPEFLKFLPKVTLGDVETQDLPAVAGAIARLETAGFLHVSQRRQLDAFMGIPVRSQEAAAEEIEAAQQAREALPEPGSNPFGEGDEPEEDEETP
jgi:hypothetical protein